MGQQQSKDELLYQQVNYGNIEGIKALCSEGAGLEWIDKEGKTPLVLACMNAEHYNVAKALIELGANVNAYRPGRHAGTPLHHAAKRGLEHTVKLLLLHGANALVMNDDCQTPLDVARVKGYSNVVRAIESHICLFSGWMREFYGPGFLEVLAPQLVSRKVWVVVLPCGARNPRKPFKLELAIYSGLQDAQPRATIALWKANLEDPKFHQSDPSVAIVDNAISRRRRQRRSVCTSREGRCKRQELRQARIKLAPANESDKQQLQLFCNACKGIPQADLPPFLHNNNTPAPVPATAPPATEDLELAMAINASLQSAMERPPVLDTHPTSEATTSTSYYNSPNIPAVQTNAPAVVPSAPQPTEEVIKEGPVQYPAVDSSPVNLSVEDISTKKGEKNEKGDSSSSSSCVICLDAPVEGACIPCGHMAGCMSCLSEIKAKKWGCPVCRARIDQIVRLYAV